MRTTTINIYHFDELDKNAVDFAIKSQRKFLIISSSRNDFDNDKEYIDYLNKINSDDDYIINIAKSKSYYKDGSLAAVFSNNTLFLYGEAYKLNTNE
jgi:hypothetical protein